MHEKARISEIVSVRSMNHLKNENLHSYLILNAIIEVQTQDEYPHLNEDRRKGFILL